MKSLSKIRQTLQETTQLDELHVHTLQSYWHKAKKDPERQQGTDRAATQLNQKRPAYLKSLETGKRSKLFKEEQLEESHAWSLPMVLLLRRKTIRNFSDGTQVALYYNDRIDRYFSIPVREPVAADRDPIGVNESFECDSNFDHLQLLAEDLTASPLKFADGSELPVDRDTANKVLMLYTQLNESNQQKFLENIDNRAAFDKFLTLIK